MSEKTAQVTLAHKRFIMDGVTYGKPFYVTPEMAQKMIAAGVVRLVGSSIGPSETKPGEPSEKKESAVTETAGPSTDLAKSAESGSEQSSASALVPASPVTNAGLSVKPKRGRPKKSA